ncbi:DsbA family oxidoreductase, partial [Stenotrophomonas maltophilia]|uniref:DsbA family oxidoreductase n=4 Tax=Pseudomonadota TaxID=1224 RepID=UPI001953B463
FAMNSSADSRIYNTFDAHRLLHWAEIEGRQAALKHALFETYFTDQRDPSNHDVLVAAAEKAGLDGAVAREVLA